MTIKGSLLMQINNRTDITKPMEDYGLLDNNNSIYIIADGTTRPHEEYNQNGKPTGNSIASLFASEISGFIHKSLVNGLIAGVDIPDLIKNSLVSANEYWANKYPGLSTGEYPPTAALLVIVIKNDTLYYFNTCDTIGVLIRNNTKIVFTERHNRRVKREACFNKQFIYNSIYNHIENDYGYGMLNGNRNFNSFINVGHFQIELGDKIILSSDGMFDYFETIPARILSLKNPEEMLNESSAFDQLPYSRYSDDKCLIILTIEK